MRSFIKGLLFFTGLFLLHNSNLNAQVKKTTTAVKPKAKTVTTTIPFTTFDNGIKMKIKGFKVKAAALYFDDQTKVPEDNMVELDQRINLLITIESGWKAEDGKVFPGGSEIIKLNTGYEVLRSDDLFKAYDETGVSPEDAAYITLKAIITKLDDKKKFIIVTFRVWDKKGSSEITGTYKFHIK